MADETTNNTPTISIEGDGVAYAKPSVGIPANGIYATAQAADMDGDGDLDVVVMNQSNSSVDWYANDGAGNISGTAVSLTLDGYGQSLSIADVDGDGLADLVATQSDGVNGKVVWYKADGNGTFGASQAILGSQSNPYSTIAVDFDKDGDIDLLTATTGKYNIITLSTNDGTGQFTNQELSIGVGSPMEVITADINGDGRLDILNSGAAIVSEDNVASGTSINISINNGDGTFTTTVIDAGSTPEVWDIEAADVDGDGKLDIVATNPNSTVSLSWYKGNGDGTFGAAQDISAQYAGRTDAAIGDLDGDGDVDIVAMEGDSGNGNFVSWFENDGSGHFTEHKTGLYIDSMGSVELADLDGNGLLDIVRGGRAGASFETRNTADVALAYKTIAVNENAASALTGISFGDDTTGASVTVNFSVENGTLNAQSGSGVTVAGDGTGTLVLTGSLADINAFVAGEHVAFTTVENSEADVKLTVSIADGVSGDAKSASASVLLDVTPAPDLPPTGLALTGNTVAEESAIGTVVGTFSATDPEGQPLTYTLTNNANGLFSLVTGDNGTVSLVVNGELDYETAPSHTIAVKVSDGVNEVSGNFDISVTDIVENLPPTSLALSNNAISEDAAVGAVVGTFSATDPEGQPLTYSLTDDANGLFALVTAENGSVNLVVNGNLDYEAATSHAVTVAVSDGVKQTSETFTVAVTDVDDEPEAAGTIAMDASTATHGINFDTYVTDFLSTATAGGFPVFDNSGEFSGEEMVVAYGSDASSKYALAHGSLEYYFSTHTVWGTVETLDFGTLGSGTYDSNGYLTRTNVELSITGLTLHNAQPTNSTEEAAIEATGAVHNLAAVLMGGSGADADRIALLNEQLDAYAQNVIGSAYGDTYTGTIFNDTVTGRGGNDVLNGGDGDDTAVYSGDKADYSLVENENGSWTVTDNRTGGSNDGADTITNVEYLKFADVVYSLEDGGEDPVNQPPTDLALSAATVEENSAAGTVIGVLSATDPEGDALIYSLADDADGLFDLVIEDGVTKLVVAAAIDYETATSHDVTVTVSDGTSTVNKTFAIAVTDVDDTPDNTAPTDISLSKKTIAEDAKVGDVVGVLSATDAEGDALTWSLSGGGGKFDLVTKNGTTRLVADGALDYEVKSSYTVKLTASDGDLQTSQNVTIKVTDVVDLVEGNSHANTLKGASGADLINGLGGNDKLYGYGGADTLNGGAGKDLLKGDGGADILAGGKGVDKLYGGAGADDFVFATGDSGKTKATADTIYDFAKTDSIDLTGWDANSKKGGVQDFDFIGSHDFSGHAGELRFEKAKSDTWIEGDTNGDGKANFFIHLDDAVNLKAAHFDL